MSLSQPAMSNLRPATGIPRQVQNRFKAQLTDSVVEGILLCAKHCHGIFPARPNCVVVMRMVLGRSSSTAPQLKLSNPITPSSAKPFRRILSVATRINSQKLQIVAVAVASRSGSESSAKCGEWIKQQRNQNLSRKGKNRADTPGSEDINEREERGSFERRCVRELLLLTNGGVLSR